jgi:ATPase subunit of ABC transporter with duplicated ATPase domains
MRDWQKWRAGAKARSARASRAAIARWDAVRAARAGEPVRETRVTEITVRDSHRPMEIVRLQSEETRSGWSRRRVSHNGVSLSIRPLGPSGIASLIAGLIS